MKKLFSISQPKQILLGLVLGLLVGFIFGEKVAFLRIFGDIFLKMIKMTIAPLIFVTVTHVFCSNVGGEKMGKVAFKSILFYKVATVITAVFGICVAVFFKPGVGIHILPETIGASTVQVMDTSKMTINEMVLHIFPDNLFVAFYKTDIIQILVFSCFFGIAISRLSHHTSNIVRAVDSISKVILYMIGMIIKFTPIGIFGIMAYLAGTQELSTFKSLFYLVLMIYGCGFVVGYIFYGVTLLCYGLNPIPFFKKVFEVQSFAFLVSSSAASIPLAKLVASKKMGVSEGTASLAVSLGGGFNMSGTALHLGATAIFLAQVYGADLGMAQYVQIVVLSIMLTMGAVGIPAASLVMMPVILSAIGVPPEYVAVYVGIDRFLDMVRSMLNATGDVLAAVIVDKSQGTLNKELYNKMDAKI
jgi:Na+/H+-dicarboxylate symporter